MGWVSFIVQRRYKPAASRNQVFPEAPWPALAQAVVRGCGVLFSHFQKTLPQEADKPSYRTIETLTWATNKPPQSTAIPHACYPSWGQQHAQHTGGLPQILLTAGECESRNLTAARSMSDASSPLSFLLLYSSNLLQPHLFPSSNQFLLSHSFSGWHFPNRRKKGEAGHQEMTSYVSQGRAAVLSKEQRSPPFSPSNARALCNTSSNL